MSSKFRVLTHTRWEIRKGRGPRRWRAPARARPRVMLMAGLIFYY